MTLIVESIATDLIGPISFQVQAGECLALVGVSGAGKSLLLRAIADLDPNRGQVWFNGRSRQSMLASEWRKTVALVPAESGWWADHVGDHFVLRNQIGPLLNAVGLPDCLDWEVLRLSTGERQRLAIARALCASPSALLLDEPTASLDEAATLKVEALIRECCGRDMPVILVTHDDEQVDRVADQRIQLADGKIYASTQTKER